jgi:hypothetical protein
MDIETQGRIEYLIWAKVGTSSPRAVEAVWPDWAIFLHLPKQNVLIYLKQTIFLVKQDKFKVGVVPADRLHLLFTYYYF